MFSKLSSKNPMVKLRPMLHQISRCVTQVRFYRCCRMLQYVLGYTRSLSIILQSKFCDFMKAQEARVLVLLFQGRFRCKVSWSVSGFPPQMKMTFCRQSQEVHKGEEQTPQSKVSKIIIVLTTFFHSLIIYHI